MTAEKPIIIIVSTESYLSHRELKRWRDTVLNPATASFNHDRFVAGHDSVSAIVDAANMLPMMAERRLIEVRHAENFSKEELESLQAYFQAPESSTLLLMQAEKVDMRLKAWKLAKEFIVELKPPYANQRPAWIVAESQKMGLTLKPEAAHWLCEVVGDSLQTLVSELEKVALYLSPRKVITLDDLKKSGVLGGAVNVFDLAKDVGARDLAKVSLQLDGALQEGESPVKLLALIQRQLRLLIQTREALEARRSQGEIASLIKLPPFFVGEYVQQAKKWSLLRLKEAFRATLQADRDLKRSRSAKSLIMKKYLAEICLTKS